MTSQTSTRPSVRKGPQFPPLKGKQKMDIQILKPKKSRLLDNMSVIYIIFNLNIRVPSFDHKFIFFFFTRFKEGEVTSCKQDAP